MGRQVWEKPRKGHGGSLVWEDSAGLESGDGDVWSGIQGQ